MEVLWGPKNPLLTAQGSTDFIVHWMRQRDCGYKTPLQLWSCSFTLCSQEGDGLTGTDPSQIKSQGQVWDVPHLPPAGAVGSSWAPTGLEGLQGFGKKQEHLPLSPRLELTERFWTHVRGPSPWYLTGSNLYINKIYHLSEDLWANTKCKKPWN